MQTKENTNLYSWLNKLIAQPFSLVSITSDASLRKYYHLVLAKVGHQTNASVKYHNCIVMDASLDNSVEQFVYVANLLERALLCVPKILDYDAQQGFIVLSDLGSTHYLDVLNQNTMSRLYTDAMQSLLKQYSISRRQLQATDRHKIPIFSRELLQEELNLFTDWFLLKQHKVKLQKKDKVLLQGLYDLLIAKALEQPQVLVHRDFHSRNLMVTNYNSPGILDFQDAVLGPISYDIVSLLKDCYITWPEALVYNLALQFKVKLEKAGLLSAVSDKQFIFWFDFMGLQRHLKVLGIFVRLALRDGKQRYLADLPRVIYYVKSVLNKYTEYSEIQFFNRFLEQHLPTYIEEQENI